MNGDRNSSSFADLPAIDQFYSLNHSIRLNEVDTVVWKRLLKVRGVLVAFSVERASDERITREVLCAEIFLALVVHHQLVKEALDDHFRIPALLDQIHHLLDRVFDLHETRGESLGK